MTQEDLERLIDRNSQIKTVPTQVGIDAGLKLAALADEHGIDWAFAGGIAMHIYGYVRATTDVDLIASKLLDLESQKDLSFGGASYQVELGDDTVTVDWIVRDDESDKFYAAALANAVEVKSGIRIITPEWMVVLKHLAGRPKDQLDLIWLLQESGLVDRQKVVSNIKSVLGEHAIYLLKDIQSEFDYADVIRMRGERSKYE